MTFILAGFSGTKLIPNEFYTFVLPFSSTRGESSRSVSKSGSVCSGQYGEDRVDNGKEVDEPKVPIAPSNRVPSCGGAEWFERGKLP